MDATTSTRDTDLAEHPSWLREIDVALTSASHLVVSGNTSDLHLLPAPSADTPTPTRWVTLSTTDAIERVLRRAGHRTILRFDPVNGMGTLADLDHRADSVMAAALGARPGADPGAAQGPATTTHPGTPGAGGRAGGATSPPPPPLGDSVEGTEQLIGLLRALPDAPATTALVIEGAPRLASGGDVHDPSFHRLMAVAERVARDARSMPVEGSHRAPLYRTVVWVLERPNELPTWFVSGRRIRTVSVPDVTLSSRRRYAQTLARVLPEVPSEPEALGRITETFAESTAGLSLSAMLEVSRLAMDQGIRAADIEDAVRMYRVGIPDNPWHAPELRERIHAAPQRLSGEVLGQPRAIRKAVDILIRSASGLNGAQAKARGSRPQGVLFFAGPTGVGKTELAKELAALVFGSRDAMHRFDMSEFSQEQSEARLIGSPPGFRDHDAGGELTNAVRQDPFSLLLFDEIDKSHPRILDKFLQILEDGRLTDGSGSTVHFSESLIVFTSNLGIYEQDAAGTRRQVVSAEAPYAEVESRVSASVKDHFTYVLGRPEILNRIGDNVVVFDFIHADVGARIALKGMENVARSFQETQGARLTWTDDVARAVQDAACQNLDFGGRGVGTVIESMLVNPLGRALFDLGSRPRGVHVIGIDEDAQGWSVRVDVEE